MSDGGAVGGALEHVLGSILGAEVSLLERRSGGASRETWSFRAGGRGYVLQRRRGGVSELAGDVATEVRVLAAAADAGVAVPTVVASGDGVADGVGAPWMVCELVDGEALPRRLLRDDRFATGRAGLAAECGAAMARVHRIDPAALDGRPPVDDPVRALRDVLDLTSSPRPVLDAGLRWLELHPPPDRPAVVVHGDFRTGNLLVRPDADGSPALAAVLDWELAHLGNPVEDLGWFCVRAWRFGSPHRAGGFGSVDQLLAGYHAADGSVAGHRDQRPVTDDELRWWELYGTVRWGVICAVQCEQHLGGSYRSVELATIGRRTCETEYDALGLLRELTGTGAR